MTSNVWQCALSSLHAQCREIVVIKRNVLLNCTMTMSVQILRVWMCVRCLSNRCVCCKRLSVNHNKWIGHCKLFNQNRHLRLCFLGGCFLVCLSVDTGRVTLVCMYICLYMVVNPSIWISMRMRHSYETEHAHTHHTSHKGRVSRSSVGQTNHSEKR